MQIKWSWRTSYGSTIHNLKFGEGFTFIVQIRARTCGLTLDERDLHVLDFNSHEQKVYFANNNIF